MGDKDELSEFMQDYNDDCQATITAGQLQHLVNEKNAADARIQELEANRVVCAAGCRERKELMESKVKIKELEAQVERLRVSLQELSLAWDEHQNPDDGVASDAREALSETPAQSLEAVKREVYLQLANEIERDDPGGDPGFTSISVIALRYMADGK